MNKYAVWTDFGAYVVVDNETGQEHTQYISVTSERPENAIMIDPDDIEEVSTILGGIIDTLIRGTNAWLPGYEKQVEDIPGGVRLEVFVE